MVPILLTIPTVHKDSQVFLDHLLHKYVGILVCRINVVIPSRALGTTFIPSSGVGTGL